jgi:NAD(P)-dependent dehydrogenase (short-subunit alcohol dehydrogenase family)
MASAPGPVATDARSITIAEQVVVVTGGGRGLGRSIAEAFLREGARVVINYNQSREAAEHFAAAHPGRAIAVQADVRVRTQVDSLMSQAHRALTPRPPPWSTMRWLAFRSTATRGQRQTRSATAPSRNSSRGRLRVPST